MSLNEILEAFSKAPNNSDLCFKIAKAYYDLNEESKSRDFIKKGLTMNISSVPFMNAFDEQVDELQLTYIIVKAGSYSHGQQLDGFSFFSYLVYELVENLLSQKRKNIIMSLNNIQDLSDMGVQMLLYLRDRARELGGDIVVINVCEDVSVLAKEIGTQFYPQVYSTSIEAVEAFRKTNEAKTK